MRARRRAAAIAAAGLLALLLSTQSVADLRRRTISLTRFAPRELAVRRLGGSAAAFDRRFFSFLENARRSLPAATRGVVLEGVEDNESYLYLARYHLAPLDVSVGPFPDRGAPPGWVIAVYGRQPSSDAGVLARLPEGYLRRPEP